MKDQPPIFLTDINIHSDTQAEPRKLSSLALYIDLWQEGKPAPGQTPPVTSLAVVIFRRIGVRAEIRIQNPVLLFIYLISSNIHDGYVEKLNTNITETEVHMKQKANQQ
jgi:hypothetical protein